MTTPKRTVKCAICDKPAGQRAENPSYPFCSPRCRQVDLGKWLGEEYRVAARSSPADEQEDELSPTEGGTSEDDSSPGMH